MAARGPAPAFACGSGLASGVPGANIAHVSGEIEEPPGLDYPRMVHEALRDVVRQALLQVAEEGLPGEHHFYVSFKTRDPGVRLPPHLLELHPEEMTVILQHQFWDLFVDRDAFSVTLTFGGSRQGITVPFSALTAFADPSVPFGLRFEAPEPEPEGPREAGAPEEAEPAARPEDGAGEDAKVVRFDRFRRKD